MRTSKGVYALSCLAGISQRPTARNPRSQKKVHIPPAPHAPQSHCPLTPLREAKGSTVSHTAKTTAQFKVVLKQKSFSHFLAPRILNVATVAGVQCSSWPASSDVGGHDARSRGGMLWTRAGMASRMGTRRRAAPRGGTARTGGRTRTRAPTGRCSARRRMWRSSGSAWRRCAHEDGFATTTNCVSSQTAGKQPNRSGCY